MCTNRLMPNPERKSPGCCPSLAQWQGRWKLWRRTTSLSQKRNQPDGGERGNRSFVSHVQSKRFPNLPVWRRGRGQNRESRHPRRLPTRAPGRSKGTCVVPVLGPNPSFQGAKRAGARAGFRGAALSWCGCCPARLPPCSAGRSQAGAPPRSAPGPGRPWPRSSCGPPAPEHPESALRSACGWASDPDPGGPSGEGGRGAPGAGLSVTAGPGLPPGSAGAAPGPCISEAQRLWGRPVLVARHLGCCCLPGVCLLVAPSERKAPIPFPPQPFGSDPASGDTSRLVAVLCLSFPHPTPPPFPVSRPCWVHKTAT